MSKNIFVYADWESISKPTLIGILNADLLRGKEIFSFEYDSQWLKTQQFFLDLDLMFYKGRQYTPQDKSLFGIFTDSCPDRWGRLLMTRREAILAREEKRAPKKLVESDFLLGIQDSARMGALRFKTIKMNELGFQRAAVLWSCPRKVGQGRKTAGFELRAGFLP